MVRHLFGWSFRTAAGTPKHIADVRRASDGQTQLVARQINYGQRHTRFAPSDFTLGPDGLTCPNSVTTTRAYRAGGADGFDYRFLASECHGCPLWELCRDPKAQPDSHRTVFISDYALLHEPDLPISTHRQPRPISPSAPTSNVTSLVSPSTTALATPKLTPICMAARNRSEIRCTIHAAARRQVLGRLLALNHARYAAPIQCISAQLAVADAGFPPAEQWRAPAFREWDRSSPAAVASSVPFPECWQQTTCRILPPP